MNEVDNFQRQVFLHRSVFLEVLHNYVVQCTVYVYCLCYQWYQLVLLVGTATANASALAGSLHGEFLM